MSENTIDSGTNRKPPESGSQRTDLLRAARSIVSRDLFSRWAKSEFTLNPTKRVWLQRGIAIQNRMIASTRNMSWLFRVPLS
jgi:hypothetical protein